MGLLDDFDSLPQNQRQAMTQGLLSAGLGILANNYGHRGQLGPALGAGGAEGLQAYQGALTAQQHGLLAAQQLKDAQLGNQMKSLQFDQLKMNLARDARIRERERLLPSGAPGAVAPTPAPQSGMFAPPPSPLAPMSGGVMEMGAGAPISPAPSVPRMTAPGGSVQQTAVQRLLAMAQIRHEENDPEGAQKLWDAAAKLQPKFKPELITDANGNLNALDEQGNLTQLAVKRAPEVGHIETITGPNGLPQRVALDKQGNTMRELGPTYAPEFDPRTIPTKVELEKQLFPYKHAVSAAGASRQITNVNAYAPASEEAQKEFMKDMSKERGALQYAPTALANIERAKVLVKNNPFVGSGAEQKLGVVKFLNNNLGMSVSTEGVKNAEELRSRLFMGVMDNLKKMDAQPSELQQQVLQDSLGRINTDPGALPRVLDVFGGIIKQKGEIYNRRAKSAESRGVKFPEDPYVSLDPAPMASGNAPSVRRYNPATGKIE